MKILELFKKPDLDNTLLIGYYGGGNYGDELLMEVLSNLFHKNGHTQLRITYHTPKTFSAFHHDFGYEIVPFTDKKYVLRSLFKSKNVLIGGGGLWGMDVNVNIFILSSMLFFSRWFLRKKVYLVGVGYYSSTNWLGHVSAWLAGKAANLIIARDEETLKSFGRLNKRVSIDTDIAWYIKSLDLSSYGPEVKKIERLIPVSKKTLFITLRRFKQGQNNYTDLIEACMAANQDKDIIVALMEPKEVDPKGYERICAWQRKYKNIQITDFAFNPLSLFLYFQKHRKELFVISPQFHSLITAHLNNVAFLPLVYDNKSMELLKQIGVNDQIHIRSLTASHLQAFIDRNTSNKAA